MDSSPLRKYAFWKRKKTQMSVDLWLVPYGDLITIIMIFFLLMWAMAYFLKDKSVQYEQNLYAIQKFMGGNVNHKEEELNKIAEMDAKFKDKGLSDAAQMSVSAHQIRILLRSPILFNSGSAELKPDIYSLLNDISRFISEMPGSIVIEGHTDNVPISGGRYKSNFSLSAARAFAVIQYLLQQNLPPDRLSILGQGETKPLYANDTEEHRALNRRIEIIVVRQN